VQPPAAAAAGAALQPAHVAEARRRTARPHHGPTLFLGVRTPGGAGGAGGAGGTWPG
jgi:hypothetical protein